MPKWRFLAMRPERLMPPIQQQEMLVAMKGILTDELIFVMA
ncbi:hypothetical protein JOC78_001026 [Bacillus ectoiniformans]|nr:hypothetical protein [Bacillus ectoiniformans]MBM7648086.1 hypothetical protein [Bacillus ectoiniformans]